MRKVLVIVDMQNDFIDGSLGTKEAQAIVPNVVDKIRNYEDKSETLILFTKDTHYENYMDTLEGQMLPVPHCIENTKGWSIRKEVSNAVIGTNFLTYSSDKIIKSRIYKNTFGSDVLEDLFVELKDYIEEIEFCGLYTDACVVSNVLMARQKLPEVKITVDASCCAGITPETYNAALITMKMCQVNVIRE